MTRYHTKKWLLRTTKNASSEDPVLRHSADDSMPRMTFGTI
jgi:hypothetical protein